MSSTVFARPHYRASSTFVELGMRFDGLQNFDSYTQWRQRLSDELAEVYGWNDADSRIASVIYSTDADGQSYPSQVDEKLFTALAALHAAQTHRDDLDAQLRTAAEAQHEADQSKDASKRLTRKEREAEDAARRALRILERDLANAESALTFEKQKLRNAFDMCRIRVYVK